MTKYTLYNKDKTIMGWLIPHSGGLKYVHKRISIEAVSAIFRALRDLEK